MGIWKLMIYVRVSAIDCLYMHYAVIRPIDLCDIMDFSL